MVLNSLKTNEIDQFHDTTARLKPNRDAYKSLRPRSSAFNCDSLEEVFDEMKKLYDVRWVRLAEPK